MNSNATNVTRRSFIGAAGVALAGTAALAAGSASAEEAAQTQAAASAPSFLAAPEPVAEDQIAQTIEADVLVVGAGVAGMSAARGAAESGASVVVVEKAAGPQCRGNFGCQVGAIDSSYQQSHGITVDKAALVERFQRDTLQFSNQFFIQYWADHSGETIDWCLAACPDVVEMELGTSDNKGELADGQVGIVGNADVEGYDPSTERYPEFNTQLSIVSNNTELFEGGFSLMLECFQQVIESAGGTFLFNTFGRYLEKDGERVTGLIAQAQDGSHIRINAANTILACGDFASNQEMRDYYTPQCSKLMCLFSNTDCEGNVCNTGDGHRMAMWAGGHMECAPYAPMAHLTTVNDVLVINRRGERLGNEDLGAQSITNAILKQPGQQVFVISGSSRGSVVLDPGPAGQASDETYDDFTAMAAAIGEHCDPAVLQATVERYNEMCATGEDTEYGKDPKYMVALDAPYYVTPSGPGNLLVIMGGITCNNHCQVIDDNDVEIPGLFVVGNNQGGRFGAEYPMTAPGISHGIAFTLGKYVGEYVASLK